MLFNPQHVLRSCLHVLRSCLHVAVWPTVGSQQSACLPAVRKLLTCCLHVVQPLHVYCECKNCKYMTCTEFNFQYFLVLEQNWTFDVWSLMSCVWAVVYLLNMGVKSAHCLCAVWTTYMWVCLLRLFLGHTDLLPHSVVQTWMFLGQLCERYCDWSQPCSSRSLVSRSAVQCFPQTAHHIRWFERQMLPLVDVGKIWTACIAQVNHNRWFQPIMTA